MLIDPLSFSCLSNIESKGIDICIINEEDHTKKIKPNNIADVVTLAKICKNIEMREDLMNAKK